METRYLYIFRFILFVSDILLIIVSFISGYFLVYNAGSQIEYPATYWQNIILSCVLWPISSGIFCLYTATTLRSREAIYCATLRSLLLYAFFFQAYLFFTDVSGHSKHFIVLFYSFTIILFFFSRLAGPGIQNFLIKRFNVRKAVAVLGGNAGGKKLAEYLGRQSNIDFMGFLGKSPFGKGNHRNNNQNHSISEQLKAAS
jgi:FlaA1/EpsC-like NDP-sugar epimerase